MRRSWIGLVASLGLLAGCDGGKDADDTGGADPSWVAMQDVVQENCSPCHVGGSSGSLTLDEDSFVANTVDVVADGDSSQMLVVCGDSAISALYLKVTDTPPFGDQMPTNGTLSSDEQNAIADWIDGGCLE